MSFKNRLLKAINEEIGIADPQNVEQAKAEVEKIGDDLLDIASQLQDAISQHKRGIIDAEMQINNIIEQLNTKMGWEIRKRQRKLMVSHGNGSLNTGYFSQKLGLKPDLANKQWSVQSNDGMGRKFLRETPPETLALSSDHGPMADAVVKFFKNQFRTLN